MSHQNSSILVYCNDNETLPSYIRFIPPGKFHGNRSSRTVTADKFTLEFSVSFLVKFNVDLSILLTLETTNSHRHCLLNLNVNYPIRNLVSWCQPWCHRWHHGWHHRWQLKIVGYNWISLAWELNLNLLDEFVIVGVSYFYHWCCFICGRTSLNFYYHLLWMVYGWQAS